MKQELEVICPYCGSDNCYKTRKPGWVTGIIILTFGVPILFPSQYMHCFDCGKDFKIKRNG